MKNYRWGDIALISIKELPKDLKVTDTKIIAEGNNGHDHMMDKGTLYIIKDSKTLLENEFIFGYLDAKDTTLLHEEHGIDVGNKLREIKIEDGFYELRGQKEYTAEGMKPVID